MSISFGPGAETAPSWAVIGRLNPVTKLAITGVITVGLLLSLDTITAGLILIAELLMLPFIGLRPALIGVRIGILTILAAAITLVNSLFSRIDGEVGLLVWGPFNLSTASLAAAAPVGLRVLALSLPAVLLLATTDPLLLADSVQQQLRVPARYALSMVVGLRLLPLLVEHWQELSAARRARGLTARGPISGCRAGGARTTGLMVEAIRRAVRMADTMTARGFDPYAPRTSARESKLRFADWTAMVAALAVVTGASWLSIRSGCWSFALAWPF